jgi:SAM-dependent methyltransferase
VDGSCAIEEYFRLHDYQQPGYLALFQSVLKRQATVADCGCGGGSLLDVVKGFAGRTIAIEPYQGYHASLRERGHQVYASLEAALEGEASQVDLALSVHVIEHTVDPLQYLRAIRALLKPAGHAVVVTPNLDDILLKLDFARVAPWYFRKEHNYYFTTEGIEWAARRSGFAVVRRIFYHEFGMGNALLWLKDRRPSGHTPVPGINAEADAFWRGYLETTGQANNVGAVLQNAGS